MSCNTTKHGNHSVMKWNSNLGKCPDKECTIPVDYCSKAKSRAYVVHHIVEHHPDDQRDLLAAINLKRIKKPSDKDADSHPPKKRRHNVDSHPPKKRRHNVDSHPPKK
eukprot:395463_1